MWDWQNGGRAEWLASSSRMRTSPQRSTMTGRDSTLWPTTRWGAAAVQHKSWHLGCLCVCSIGKLMKATLPCAIVVVVVSLSRSERQTEPGHPLAGDGRLGDRLGAKTELGLQHLQLIHAHQISQQIWYERRCVCFVCVSILYAKSFFNRDFPLYQKIWSLPLDSFMYSCWFYLYVLLWGSGTSC